MNEDVKWLFGVILIFGMFWAVSGPQNDTATQQNQNSYQETTDLSHVGTNSSASTGNQVSTPQGIKQSLEDAGVKANQIQAELNALNQAKQASSLVGKLSVTSLSRGNGASGEYVIVQANPANTEQILITGLRLQSAASGSEIAIPKAVKLPFQNQVNQEEPIFLKPGEYAYIITGPSPLGYSFQPNICTGFFNQYQSFYPGIPSRCPSPRETDLPNGPYQYNDACRDYINSLPGCTVITNPPQSVSPECQRYVTEELSYSKCVAKYKNSQNFFDGNWRVYLNRSDALWKSRREVIKLLDQNGKTIDAIAY